MKDTIECLKVNVNLQRVFTCVAEGESRSRSAVTPSVCPSVGLSSVCPSVCPSVRPSQNLVNATPLKLLIQLCISAGNFDPLIFVGVMPFGT